MYGLLISIGTIISILFAEKIVKDKKLEIETYWKLVFWGILSGIVGARLYHVMSLWQIYFKNPAYIFAIWNGGMGIFGGIALALFVIWKLERKDFLKWTDIFVRVLPLGQAIGRWGNYFNSELLPFAIYESALDLILFLTLSFLSRKNPQKGLLSGLYLMGYSAIRISLEHLRPDQWTIGGINITYTLSLGIILLTSILLWKTKKTENGS